MSDTLPDDGTVDMPSCSGGAERRGRANRSPAANEQLYDIRLPDGTNVQMSASELAEYQGDWTVTLTIVQSERLYNDIMGDMA